MTLLSKGLARTRGIWLAGAAAALAFSLPVTVRADTQTRVVVTAFPSDPAATLAQSETLAPGDANWQLSSAFTYDSNGNRKSTTVSGVNITAPPATSTTYDPSGRFPATSTDAAGHQTKFTYDPALGVITSQTDVNNLTTSWSYDAWGRKTLEVRPDGNRTAYAYKLCTVLSGEPACPALAVYIAETIPQNASGTVNGPISIAYYDKLDRVVSTAEQAENNFSTPIWSFVDTHYDNQGRVSWTTQPYFQGSPAPLASLQAYDAIGRVVTRTYADGNAEHATYAVYTKTTTDTLGRTTTTNSDSHGVTSVLDPAGQTTTYKHDAFGNLITITDPAGHVTSATFNIRGWRTSLTDPDSGLTQFGYDSLGQMLSRIDANGTVVYYAYDALGRMTRRWNGTQSIDFWNYDTTNGLGKIWYKARYATATQNFQYARFYTYDAYSRIVLEQVDTDSASAYQNFSYAYDSNGRLTTATRPSGLSLNYGYNARSRLTSIQNTATGGTIWSPASADAAGRLTGEYVNGGSVITTHGYDQNRGWISGVTTSINGAPMIQEAVAHAANGLVSARSDNATGLSDAFAYDVLNRLVASSGNASVPARTITYDALGNITAKSDVGGYSYGSKPHAVTTVTPQSGPVLSYAYDADGNMLSGGGRSLSYDPAGMVAAVTEGANTVSYTYSTENQRALQVTASETDHFYSFDPATHTELQSFSSGASRWVDYLHGPGGLIGAIYTTLPAGGGTASQTTLYYALDYLGSVAGTVVANGTGSVLRSYDAWGKQRFTSGADDSANTLWGQNAEARGYVGQEQVAPISLINLNARMYDAWLGRFLAVDPIIASIYNLQAMNPYSYVMNNPMTDSDPSGLCGFFACPFKAAGSFFGHAFAGPTGNVLRAVIAIAAVATWQYEILPELVAPLAIGAEETAAGVATGFSALSTAGQIADLAFVGAVGGAINTGTLRGALIGAATAEAFWGVGGLKADLGIEAYNATGSSAASGAIVGAAGIGLHAAVGCASSAAGGGQCGSGALSGGLGELITDTTPNVSDNPYIQSAVVGLGGGTGSALTGGRFGDGFFIAASGYLFNDCLHNVNCLNPQNRGPGMVDTSVGHGQWAWLPPGVAADAFTAAQFSDPSAEQAKFFDALSAQSYAAGTLLGYAGNPGALLFGGLGLAAQTMSIMISPTPPSVWQQIFDSGMDMATKGAPGLRGPVMNTVIQKMIDPAFQAHGPQ